MNNTKYVHIQNTELRGTIALEIPSKSYLEQVFSSHSSHMFLNVGVTKLHPKEHFVKRIGREKAEERMKQTVVTLASVEIDGIRHVYKLTFNDENKKMGECTLWFSTINESPNVMLLAGSAMNSVWTENMNNWLKNHD